MRYHYFGFQSIKRIIDGSSNHAKEYLKSIDHFKRNESTAEERVESNLQKLNFDEVLDDQSQEGDLLDTNRIRIESEPIIETLFIYDNYDSVNDLRTSTIQLDFPLKIRSNLIKLGPEQEIFNQIRNLRKSTKPVFQRKNPMFDCLPKTVKLNTKIAELNVDGLEYLDQLADQEERRTAEIKKNQRATLLARRNLNKNC